MLKAMLRNPEIVLSSISYILSGVSLDMGVYVPEVIVFCIGLEIHAKSDFSELEA
jgi:hypothetical protein